MIVKVDRFGSADNFSLALQKALSTLKRGDELRFT